MSNSPYQRIIQQPISDFQPQTLRPPVNSRRCPWDTDTTRGTEIREGATYSRPANVTLQSGRYIPSSGLHSIESWVCDSHFTTAVESRLEALSQALDATHDGTTTLSTDCGTAMKEMGRLLNQFRRTKEAGQDLSDAVKSCVEPQLIAQRKMLEGLSKVDPARFAAGSYEASSLQDRFSRLQDVQESVSAVEAICRSTLSSEDVSCRE